MNELNILKIDLDIKTKLKAINHLMKRLAYFNDIGFLYANKINKIELIKKRTFGARIYLNFNVKNDNNICLLETLLGSDYRKGVNQLINKHKFNMNYNNRLFDIKVYSNGKIIKADIIDITKIIKNYVLDKSRDKFNN